MSTERPDINQPINPWLEKADATPFVEALAHDEDYYYFLKSCAIRTRTRWAQSDEPLELPITVDDFVDEHDIHHMLASDNGLVISNAEITVVESGGRLKISGGFDTDTDEYEFLTEKGEVYLIGSDDTMPAINVSQEQLSRFLGLVMWALSVKSEEARLQRTAARIQRTDTEYERLEEIITCLGNYDGTSSQTTWGLVHSEETGDEIVMRLTEEETPKESTIEHKLETYAPSGHFTEEVGIEIADRSFHDWAELVDNVACIGLSRARDPREFTAEALQRPDIYNRPNFHYYRPDVIGEESDYAALCARFMKIYLQLRKAEEAA